MDLTPLDLKRQRGNGDPGGIRRLYGGKEMVTKSVPAKATKAATKSVVQRTAAKPAAKPTFSWDKLPDAETVEYTRGPIMSRVDVEADTPEPIKVRVQESYDAYQASVKGADHSVFDKERNIWVTDNARELSDARMASGKRQRLGSEEQAKEFLRLAKRYGTGKGMTVRGDVDPKDTSVAVYFAKPRETRTRS